jgi:predicted RNase H-like HicB family nuclease
MIELLYSLVIEATAEPDFFGYYSPDLEGFTGIGQSVEDCLYKAKWGMREHVELLRERGLPVPDANNDPRIVIQNAKERQAALWPLEEKRCQESLIRMVAPENGS